jgi:hypothetical protein
MQFILCFWVKKTKTELVLGNLCSKWSEKMVF